MKSSSERKVKIFPGKHSFALAQHIAEHYGDSLGQYTSEQFSDGELSYSFDESIRGHDVFLVQSTAPPGENILELLLMIDAAKRASAHYVAAVVPYFGYARQDRKDKPRVSIGAKLMANVLSASGAHRLITMDLHAGQIQGFFDIPVDHLDSTAIFIPYIKQLKLKNMMFAAPDVGSLKRARAYAQYFHTEIAVCNKHRKQANKVDSIEIIGHVKDKAVILVDDLADTAGTLCRASEVILETGARSVYALCTHPVLSGDAYENIAESGLQELAVTDTLPLKKTSPKIKVLSVAKLFAQAIENNRLHGSISSLFIN